jgi:hypothetical protein
VVSVYPEEKAQEKKDPKGNIANDSLKEIIPQNKGQRYKDECGKRKKHDYQRMDDDL